VTISRNVFWVAFFASILVSWWWLYSMSLSMNMDLLGRMSMGNSTSGMDMPKEPMSGMDMPKEPMSGMDMPEEPMSGMDMPMYTSMTHFLPLAGMWAIMMAAMMLPTMVPTLRSYEDLMVSANGTRIGWLGVLLGYSIVWVLFSSVISGIQLGLLYLNVVDMMGKAKSLWLSAAFLTAAGAFQFTRAKEVCHDVCHSPMSYFVGHWRVGFQGGVRMGLSLGAFCVGCCWLFMVLGFAGGVMNFLWMGLATLMMVLEKLPQLGHFLVRPLGLLLILSGPSIIFLF
jgi:predicted metal-binding membrane protein